MEDDAEGGLTATARASGVASLGEEAVGICALADVLVGRGVGAAGSPSGSKARRDGLEAGLVLFAERTCSEVASGEARIDVSARSVPVDASTLTIGLDCVF